MKRFVLLALAAAAATITTCGPSRAELRSELRSIEGEMIQLDVIARQLQAQMNQAGWQSFGGGYNIGGGLANGDGSQFLGGLGDAIVASDSYDRAELGLREVAARYDKLAARRMEIFRKLR